MIFTHFGVFAAPSAVVFDAAVGGLRLTDRTTGTKYRKYVSGGVTLWEAATVEDNLDITFSSTRGPVFPDRSNGTLYRQYIDNGIVLKETVTAAEPDDHSFVSGAEVVMTDRATGTKYREYISLAKEYLEVVQ